MSTDFPERDRIARAGPAAPDLKDLTVIDVLIEEQRTALDAADSARRARKAYALAFALNQRFQRSGDPADLRAAVPYLQIAVAAGADDPFEARYVSELGAALGYLANLDTDTGLADEAVRLAERAVALTPVGHPQHAARVSTQGVAHCRRGLLNHLTSDLDAGVDKLREAIQLAHPADPRLGSYFLQLSLGLIARFEHTDSVDDVESAFESVQLAGLAVHPYALANEEIPATWAHIRTARAKRRRGAAR
jgi:tetratricopeptide (TPR) repeat protein